ncbi:uncharacterized protein AMSG_05566 [Thecamonas trahens ATCC 50062]|uniref:Centromere protein O n=1 Tax=Thecamonas trahens ATCC 50062 TaxID=461836 RepID=A0A0L0DDZ3_THETB|nr:hypothetical protein AMSG_05566 [Thecamonas trahens ATCC 50062]KNC49538.1 hypothetical protein AMSG_05566 [Thecamonas trahens ATCC 50062]|eukprot:XP_013757650.1 hypothetical protein AMSG_05566 [Thecamonas trahens ATCC 50062]
MEVSRGLTTATLDALTALVDNVNALAAVQTNNKEMFSSLRAMQEEARRLQKKHDELVVRLRNVRRRSEATVRAQVAAGAEVVAGAGEGEGEGGLVKAVEGDALEKLQDDVAQRVGERADEDLLQAYRLAGKSVFPVGDDKLGIRFETFYQGAFFESYFVILALDEEAGKPPSVFRHTLPHFLPLDAVASEFLGKSVATFIEKVSDLLHAFVARREHVRVLQEMHGELVSNVATTLAFDVVQFTGVVPSGDGDTAGAQAEFQIVYDKLDDELPSRAAVNQVPSRKRRAETLTSSGEPAAKRLKGLERVFLESALPDAYAFVVSGSEA